MACSDTERGKNQTSLHYSLLCNFCLTPWNNNACTEAPEPQIPSLLLLGGMGPVPTVTELPRARGHPWPPLPQLGSSLCLWEAEGQGWSVTLGRQVLLCLSEQGPAGSTVDSRAIKILSSSCMEEGFFF